MMAEYDLNAVAFPKLDEAQMAALGGCAKASLKEYRAGQALFDVGQRDFKFFVVKSGEVEVVDPAGEAPKTVAVHGPGEFTGDVAHLTGTPAVVRAVARTDCEVYRRQPFLLETSRPGVFAAGDVRSGSVKRVASAVGERSMAVQFVHECMKEM
jgi:signal-transduction protein with cAMP-binding, CBS, and nucleotidyltransferase domain